MGAGASIPAELDKDAAKECAGPQWKDEYDKLFGEFEKDSGGAAGEGAESGAKRARVA